MPFGQQLQALLHNKKALYGMGGAAALGGIALYRRKKATGTGTSSGTSSSTPYTPAGTYPNTYGTDLASALGNLDQGYSAQLQDYKGQLSQVQTALAGLQTSGAAVTAPDTANYHPSYTPTQSGTPATPAAPTPTTPAATAPAAVTVPTTTTLPAGYGWFDTGAAAYTLDSIARRFGISDATLISLNPSLAGKGGNYVVGKGVPVKVRGNALPFNLAAYKKVNPTEKF
jgi:hypothetical protein